MGSISDEFDHAGEHYVHLNNLFIYCTHLCTEYQEQYSGAYLSIYHNWDVKVKREWPPEGIQGWTDKSSKVKQDKQK